MQAPAILKIIYRAQQAYIIHMHTQTHHISLIKVKSSWGFPAVPPPGAEEENTGHLRQEKAWSCPTKQNLTARVSQKMAATQTWLTAALSHPTVSFPTQKPPDTLQF